MMMQYREFFFFNTFDIEPYVKDAYDQLTSDFNYFSGHDNFLQDEGFILLIGDVSSDEGYNEILYKDSASYLLVRLLFPPQSLTYECTIAWELKNDGKYIFNWCSDFPKEALYQYVQSKNK
jgi:hypothetical protein